MLGSHRGSVRRSVLTHVLTLDHRPWPAPLAPRAAALPPRQLLARRGRRSFAAPRGAWRCRPCAPCWWWWWWCERALRTPVDGLGLRTPARSRVCILLLCSFVHEACSSQHRWVLRSRRDVIRRTTGYNTSAARGPELSSGPGAPAAPPCCLQQSPRQRPLRHSL